MGKRSSFERIAQDRYLTPANALTFLRPHLPSKFTFCEPCAADGNLTRLLERIGGRAVAQYDITPEAPGIRRKDARYLLSIDLNGADLIITNPPWDRPVLHAMILRFSRLGVPTWLLFDAGWVNSQQAIPLMDWARGANRIHKIVAGGRFKWIPGSDWSAKDDASWHLIGAPRAEPPHFYPRLDLG